MRLVRLLLVVVLVLIAGRTAAGQDNQTDNQKTNPRPELTNPPEASHPNHLRAHIPAGYPAPDSLGDSNTCFVMHTTQVARDSKYSDATHVVNVTNCTPASRFQMKSAVVEPK